MNFLSHDTMVAADDLVMQLAKAKADTLRESLSLLGIMRTINGPLTRYTKLPVAHAPGKPGMFFSGHRLQRKSLASDPGTCMTHVAWCMLGSLTCGGGENVPGIHGAENFPAFPAHAQPAILRICQEANGKVKGQPDGKLIPSIVSILRLL